MTRREEGRPPDRRSPRTRRGDAGLTLLELMVVLVIIGLIATIAAPQLIGYLDRSKVDAARVQVRSLSTIVDLFRLDVGRFPTEREGLQALATQPAGVDRWRGPYLKSDASLIDPWGRSYAYEVSDDGRSIDIYSFGADGQEGGDGLNADVRE